GPVWRWSTLYTLAGRATSKVDHNWVVFCSYLYRMVQNQPSQRGPVSPRKGVPMHYVFGAYHLDTQRYELHHAGVPVPLRPKVFQVLAYLLAHPDRVVSKEELLAQVWPGQFVGDKGLHTYILEVRKALGDRHPPYQYLRTVRGHGYRV